uniref:Signal sequence receptor subunit 2 n=1 Tax=Mandrillus leucophaeus TaxID=9568 RepID=A0A2K5ZL80_MANLE
MSTCIGRNTTVSGQCLFPVFPTLTLSSCLCGSGKAFGMPTMRLLAFVVLALFAVTQAEEGARLLASKSLLNRYAVEGRDLTLQYNIYNVGSSAALDVELSDDSFPPEDFGIVSGMLNVKWDRIAPASNVSHTVVLRPLKAGYFNFTSATITYLAQEDGPVVIGSTSAPGQGGILAQREFDRRFSPHFLDWAAFGVMTLPSIARGNMTLPKRRRTEWGFHSPPLPRNPGSSPKKSRCFPDSRGYLKYICPFESLLPFLIFL